MRPKVLGNFYDGSVVVVDVLVEHVFCVFGANSYSTSLQEQLALANPYRKPPLHLAVAVHSNK